MSRLFPFLILILVAHIYLLLTINQIISFVTQKYFHLTPQSIYSSFTDSNKSVLLSDNHRVNILLIGQGGTNHSGGDLSDTLIIASIPLNRGDVVLIPIPRDLWINDLNSKINAAHKLGEEKEVGYGMIQLRQVVSQVTNLPIHYYLKVDFGVFSQFIDNIGGIDVDVQNSFIDNKYPISGLENAQPESTRYETISFNSGVQHMDGTIALKYVRSRNAQGQEGTDIARSERQERVVQAIKSKLFNLETWKDNQRLASVLQLTQNSIETDFDNQTYIQLAKSLYSIRKSTFVFLNIPTNLGIDNSLYSFDQALLIHPGINKTYFDQWVLIPKDNNFVQIHTYINCKIFQSNCNQETNLQNTD